MLAVLPIGGTNTTSPGNSRTSLRVLPLSKKSYKSSVTITLPFRLSCTFRKEPIFFTPPEANSALDRVAKPLTVYEPGLSTSPKAKTRIERNLPIPTLAETPTILSPTCWAMDALASVKLIPAKVNGPISGNATTPSRSTTSVNTSFF